MVVRKLASALITAGAIVALGSGSNLYGQNQNRPEQRERPSTPPPHVAEKAGFNEAFRDGNAFAASMLRLNGDIFWTPASASSNVVTRFGDEARAVFGPMPPADCAADDARVVPLEVDGNIVDLRPNPNKAGDPLEFEHKNTAGETVKWTTSIPRCDKPSLAGKLTYCGLNSRMNRVVNGSVEWLFLCRKSTESHEVKSDPYWLRSNPKFALLGTIGFNRLTGEQVFFDGRKDRKEFDWSEPFVPPGGRSYADVAGRAAAEKIYDPTFEVQCSSCHDNKNAYVINPHIAMARVGYFSGEDDARAAAFSLGDYLPLTPRDEEAPLRIIGSSYTQRYGVSIERARTVRDPNGNCTSCHTLTTQLTGQRFAADAVALEPWITNPTWLQSVGLKFERDQFAEVDAHRTDWARQSGPGKIHPWMTPKTGNDLSAESTPLGLEDWQSLSTCLWGAGGGECGYRLLYSPCPSPGAQGDGFEPKKLSIATLSSSAEEVGPDQALRITWRYLNAYGDVPKRDDVRFNLAIRETTIPRDGRAPSASDYPGIDEAKGETRRRATPGNFAVFGSTALIQNASYAGHVKFTDPVGSTDLREYRVNVPSGCNQRYLVRLLPKRFCFDQTPLAYSDEDYLAYIDVACG